MYDYVKKHYAVNPIVGNRVRLLEGAIAREDKSMGHYVMVRFEGVRWPAPCHPTSLEYLGPAAK